TAVDRSWSQPRSTLFPYTTLFRSQEMVEENGDMVGIYGWHPTEAVDYNADAEKYLLSTLEDDRVVALGETGLDYYWDTSPRDVQEKVFCRQLAIARELQLPIVIHNRDATADCYRILKEEKVGYFGGIMHSFGETPEWVEKFLDLGMHVSFSGVSTFKKTGEVREAAKLVPDDKILIETDSPYLAPVPKRGKRDRKSTRLNSSHVSISYAVFCLKKKRICGELRLQHVTRD